MNGSRETQTVNCPSCGAENPWGERFCSHCGEFMPRPGRPEPSPQQEAKGPDPEIAEITKHTHRRRKRRKSRRKGLGRLFRRHVVGDLVFYIVLAGTLLMLGFLFAWAIK